MRLALLLGTCPSTTAHTKRTHSGYSLRYWRQLLCRLAPWSNLEYNGTQMKAICIIGSPRPDGSTALLVSNVVAGMATAGAQVRQYSLGLMRIGYCTGCRECEVTRLCVQRDDMDQLLSGILESDVVLLASPSYWGDVTG